MSLWFCDCMNAPWPYRLGACVGFCPLDFDANLQLGDDPGTFLKKQWDLFLGHKCPAINSFDPRMCEMLTWQWEELGDGNDAEFAEYDCPMVKDHRVFFLKKHETTH